jgi:hypothetical protein
MSLWLTAPVFLALVGVAWSQQSDSNQQLPPEKQKPATREPDTLPLPLGSPRAIQPGTIDPLTPGEKARLALKDTFGIRALANRALLAGLNHWMNHPEEWGGNMDAYGKRFASRWGRMTVRNAIELGSDLAFKTDPRYDRCDCIGFGARTGHAWKRVFVARRDDGSDFINVSRLAGAYMTPILTDQWYPARLNTWSHKLQSGTEFLGWRGVNNMVKEFWPEIKRKVLRRGANQKNQQ